MSDDVHGRISLYYEADVFRLEVGEEASVDVLTLARTARSSAS